MRLVKFRMAEGTGDVWVNPEHVRTVQGPEDGPSASISFYRGEHGDTRAFEWVTGTPAEVAAALSGPPPVEGPMADPVLDLPMQDNDAAAATVRGYLTALLANVWDEEEGFDGKRPFGNSGWQFDLHLALIDAGLLEGVLDEDGYIESCDTEAGRAMIAEAIKRMGGAV